MRLRLAFLIIGSLSIMFSVCGCVIPAGSTRIPQSHFVYPNSNVTAVGEQATGQRKKLCGLLVFSWNGFKPEVTEEAYDQALRNSGGDLLINASENRSTFWFPYLFMVCTTKVIGTPARMEVGLQHLSGADADTPTEQPAPPPQQVYQAPPQPVYQAPPPAVAPAPEEQPLVSPVKP